MLLADHGPIFVWQILSWVNFILFLAILVVEIVAFVNCLTQRAEAFPVVGSISKAGWLGITGAAAFFTLILGSAFIYGPYAIFGMIAVAATLVYLLDVRPALRDAVDGHGSW
ncbi:MAG: hypothetical protein AUG44_13695 [Actinobacteria bacterium 13_1_20CM_3_71_11]|nr:MAG: hypothetical protein AUG44_13695 [Actinobacteria bacterium 13_1_20CM_3_71_11]